MHRLKSNWGRSLPAIAIALAAAATLAIIVAVNLGSRGSSVVASNLTPTFPHTQAELQKFTGVSCADLYLETDNFNLTPLGSAPVYPDPDPADRVLVASALSRTEPSATAGLLDVNTVVYQGPDLITGDENVIFDVVPDQGPMAQLPTPQTCATTRTAGQTGKEQNLMNQRTAFSNQFGVRASAQAKLIVGTFDPNNSEDGAAGVNKCFDTADNGPDGLVDSGDPDCYDAGSTTYIHFSTCAFSEVLGVWQRTESTNVITNKNPKAINYGRTTLYVAAGTPTSGTVPGEPNEALDPTTCATAPAGFLVFQNVTVVHARDATTDKPTLENNPAAITAGKLSVDRDGCNPVYGHVTQKPTPAATWPPASPTPVTAPTPAANCNPKPKDGQDPDGANEQSTGGYKADDWDGDGCPDWDELDHQFDHSFTAPNSASQNGLDPFNPNDCDKNFTGNFSMLVVMAHDTSPCNLGQLITEGSGPGACMPGNSPGSPNGEYFLCRANVTHAKGVDVGGATGLQEAVNLTAGCYGDSPTQVVNATGLGSDTCPAVPRDNCGDGRAGGRPPGGSVRNSPEAFLAISDATFPLQFSGVYDHQDNRLKFETCLVGGLGRSFFGKATVGNDKVRLVFDIDAHTGAGTTDLHGGLTAANCSGTPTINILGKQTVMVELGQDVDSDHDGCTDSEELSSDETAGGKRDPFNKWDYFNPALNGIVLSAAITAVVNHYGYVDTDPQYKQLYNRGGTIPGSHKWNLKPPDTIILSADITSAVDSYGHACAAKLPPPYTS